MRHNVKDNTAPDFRLQGLDEKGEERAARIRELDYKLMKFNMHMKRPVNIEESYSEKVFERPASR
ncbi:MAG: hypothetical protein HY956_03940 [Deltaproteobacteria bacterium]|nr:hypothetical protein [Deltaproteobacteria bacterium]